MFSLFRFLLCDMGTEEQKPPLGVRIWQPPLESEVGTEALRVKTVWLLSLFQPVRPPPRPPLLAKLGRLDAKAIIKK